MKTIPRAWIGSVVDWHGFDDVHYTAHVDAIRCGIATLTYFVNLPDGERRLVQAHVAADKWQQRVNRPKA